MELSPGANMDDVAEFVVEPGLYHIEAVLADPTMTSSTASP
ncbi:MAG: hypothetical protein WBC67_17820 [Candidatus Acidiferrales bacterium]